MLFAVAAGTFVIVATKPVSVVQIGRVVRDLAASIDHQPAWVGDFMPTILEAAGSSYPSEYGGQEIKPLRGESFLPAPSGNPIGRQRPIFFEHESNRAVRDGRWELSDMTADRTELCDVADRHPQVRNRLIAWHADLSRRLDVREWEGLIAMPQAGRFRQWQEDDEARQRRRSEIESIGCA